ncbi:MAG: esterase [Gammaproteobacteria bacterium]|nr:esterase [Gammaproteobacteria bacterium]
MKQLTFIMPMYSHRIIHRCAIITTAFALLLSGCAGNVMYRPNYQICTSPTPDETCKTNALQYITPLTTNDDAQQNYWLSFIEFDEQGQLHDRAQMNAVINNISAQAAQHDILITVFVHGWHHNARVGDDNITEFRKSLQQLSLLESAQARAANRKPRIVYGIYIGWRGESIDVAGLRYSTFWARKNAAHAVGHGGVTEVFARLEEIRDTKLMMEQSHPSSQTRLIIIGHSFGGAVVYSALSQVLMERFVDTRGPTGISSDVRGFGDLVVLINPAFEAQQFATLSDMANARGSYFASQLPVLAVLTSEADTATRYAFPAGRFFATMFKNDRKVTRINQASHKQQEIDQTAANRMAIGHFKDYRTHELMPDTSTVQPDLNMRQMLATLDDIRQGWLHDEANSDIRFQGSVLKHLNHSIGRNPYMLIYVDKKIIADHNEIYDWRVRSFLGNLIMLSTLAPVQDQTPTTAPTAK